MCGIVGVLRFDGAPVDRELLRGMADRLEHRGPDDHGYWSEGAAGFGHRRLSIIDLAGSTQPMVSADGRTVVCFNGEILNYRELRRQLDHPWRTGGDTETLLAAHLRYGPDAVHRLGGQFAYAVYDTATTELLLVRDRLGILPLYYYIDEHLVAFASEIKALLPALPSGPQIDELSLDAYLSLRSVPAPHTLFRGVHKLPAGHRMRVGADGRVRTEQYWSLPEEDRRPPSPAEAVDRVAAGLERAVGDALVADVPVGAYLSGGVDSSLIVALMSQLREGEGVETFAAGFEGSQHDELPYAREVSTLFGTRHHEVLVRPSDFTDLWHSLTWHRDAPVSEPSDFAVHRLAQLARGQVKVVLSGEGSDELFAGYPKYRAAPWVERASVVPAALRTSLVGALEHRLPPAASRLRIALRAYGGVTAEDRRRAWFAPFNATERAALVGRWGRHQQPRPPAGGDVVRRMLGADTVTWLPDNLLERGDRMSMATSLELRPPFLDHRLVELAFRLPTSVKLRGGTGKWVVKEVARRHLPPRIVDRRKVGFTVPTGQWFRGGLDQIAGDLLLSPNSMVASLTDRASIVRLLDRHRSGAANEEARIWPLLCLEVWHDVFFRGVGAGPVAAATTPIG